MMGSAVAYQSIEFAAIVAVIIGAVVVLTALRRADTRRQERETQLAVARRVYALRAVVGGIREDADRFADEMTSLSQAGDSKLWRQTAADAQASVGSHAQSLNEVNMSGIDSANIWPLIARLRANLRTLPMTLEERERAVAALKRVSELARGLDIQLKAAYGLT